MPGVGFRTSQQYAACTKTALPIQIVGAVVSSRALNGPTPQANGKHEKQTCPKHMTPVNCDTL